MNPLVPSEMLIAAGNGGIGAGRLVPTAAAVVGLLGVAFGWLALTRSSRHSGAGRLYGFAAGTAGLIGAAVGGLHAANAAGGFGTGNGLAGAIVAIVMGLIGLVLCGLALARHRGAKPDREPGG